MKNHNFEFTDQGYTLKLLGLCTLSFVILLVSVIVNIDLVGMGGFIFTFGVPISIFWFNRKKIKKQGQASIHDRYSEFSLPDSTVKIAYENIKTYQVESHNGTSLNIWLKNGSKFKLQANSNFCNADQFDLVCSEFEKIVERYKFSNNLELARRKSCFEQKWVFTFLTILSAGLVGGVTFAIITGKAIPLVFYGSGAGILSLWVGYYSVKHKRRRSSS